MKPSPIGILILAAGGSARMGRPKQLLAVSGKSLVRSAAEIAIDAGGDPLVTVTGAAADKVAAELRDLEVHLAFNQIWQRGMGSSIRLGVETLIKLQPALKAVIIMLCDQPRISAQTLQQLMGMYRENGARLCACAMGNTVGPPALLANEFFNELLSLPDEAGAKQLLLKHSSSLLRVDCPEAALDVDTPADYEALRAAAD